MKTLLLIRHAKSSWSDTSLQDFDRPLNERGKYDAPLMAKKIKERKIKIDVFVSSPAKRAKKTAEIFMHELNIKDKITFIPYLYEANIENFYSAIETFEDKNDTVALFAHNPGITDFINILGCCTVYDMPTCGMYALEIKTKNWKQFKEATKKILFFDYPKNT